MEKNPAKKGVKGKMEENKKKERCQKGQPRRGIRKKGKIVIITKIEKNKSKGKKMQKERNRLRPPKNTNL